MVRSVSILHVESVRIHFCFNGRITYYNLSFTKNFNLIYTKFFYFYFKPKKYSSCIFSNKLRKNVTQNTFYNENNTYANLRRLLIVRRCIDTPKCGNYPFNR